MSEFDLKEKLGGGLNMLQDSVQQGKQKIQIAQEMSQYRKLIQERSEKRADMLLQLGEDTYQKVRSGEIQDQHLRDYTLKIVELDLQLFKAQEALEQLNRKSATSTCSNCGSEIGVNDKFCGSCGQSQTPVSARMESEDLAACPTCNEQVPMNANFCACCGSRLAL